MACSSASYLKLDEIGGIRINLQEHIACMVMILLGYVCAYSIITLHLSMVSDVE